jgi:hypothetical protein
MISIAGIPVLNPDIAFSSEDRDKLYSWVMQNVSLGKLLHDMLRSNPRLETLATKGHLLEEVFEAFPPLRVNELYWPVGANKFGCAYILLSERAASLAFVLSDRLGIDDGYGCSSNMMCPLREGQFQLCPPPPPEDDKPPDTSSADGFINTLIEMLEDDWDENEVRPLRPLPVMIWNRSLLHAPAAGTDFIRTAMYPLFYIPLSQFELFAVPDFEGVGILVLVDQRFFWRFMILKKDVIQSGDVSNYFSWYKVIALTLAQNLLDFQYAQPSDPSITQKVWHDFIETELDGEPPDNTDPLQTDIYIDDRAWQGPSTNIKSFGAKYSLAEFFSIVEKSLLKRLVFKYGWQVSFRNSRDARVLWFRNLAFFVPALIYHNQEIYDEFCAHKSDFDYREKPLYQGGLPFYWNRFKIKDGLIVGLTTLLDPRLTLALPQRVRVFGDAYFTATDKDDPDFGGDDFGLLAPFAATLWIGDIVDEKGIKIPYGEYPSSLCGSLKLKPRRYIRGYKAKTEYPIYTTCTAIVRKASGPPNSAVSDGQDSGGMQILNKKRITAYAKNLVRNWLYWTLVPAPLQFARIIKWPLSGYEDAVRYDAVHGWTCVIPFTQQLYLQTGVMYSGTAAPENAAGGTGPHRLLSSAHIDTANEKVDANAIIVSRSTQSVLPLPDDVPDADYMWVKLMPYEADTANSGGNGGGNSYWSDPKRAVLMVTSAYDGIHLGFPTNPGVTPVWLPNTKPDDCTVTWWTPVMMAYPGDPTPHFGKYKFELSLSYNSDGSLTLRNDVDGPGGIQSTTGNIGYGFDGNSKGWYELYSVQDMIFKPHRLMDSELHVDTISYDPSSNDYIYYDEVSDSWRAGTASGNGFLTYEGGVLGFRSIPSEMSISTSGLDVELVGDVDAPISGERIWYFQRAFVSYSNDDLPGNYPGDRGPNDPPEASQPCSPSGAGASSECITTRYTHCQNMAISYAIYPRSIENMGVANCRCDGFISCPIIVALDPSASSATRCTYKTAASGCSYYGAPNICGDGNWKATMTIQNGSVSVSIIGPAGGTLNGTIPSDHVTEIPLTGSVVYAGKCGTLTNWVAKPYKCISKFQNGYDICGGAGGGGTGGGTNASKCTYNNTSCVAASGPPISADSDPKCQKSPKITSRCPKSTGSYTIHFGSASGFCQGAGGGDDTVFVNSRCSCDSLTICDMTAYRWPCSCKYISYFVQGDKAYGLINICGCPHGIMMEINGTTVTANIIRVGSKGVATNQYSVIATYSGDAGNNIGGTFTLSKIASSLTCDLPNTITVTAGGDKANVNGNNIDPFGAANCGQPCAPGGGGDPPNWQEGVPAENQFVDEGVVEVADRDCPDAGGGNVEFVQPRAIWGGFKFYEIEVPVRVLAGISYTKHNGETHYWMFVTNIVSPAEGWENVSAIPDVFEPQGAFYNEAIFEYELTDNLYWRPLLKLSCNAGMLGQAFLDVPPPEGQLAHMEHDSKWLWKLLACNCGVGDVPGDFRLKLLVHRCAETSFSFGGVVIPNTPKCGVIPGFFSGNKQIVAYDYILLSARKRLTSANCSVLTDSSVGIDFYSAVKSGVMSDDFNLGDHNAIVVPPYTKVTVAAMVLMQTANNPETVFTEHTGLGDSDPAGCDGFPVIFNVHRGNPNNPNSVANKPHIPISWSKCLAGQTRLMSGNVVSGVFTALVQAGLLVESGEKDPANAKVFDNNTGVYVQLVRQGEAGCGGCPTNACAINIINSNRLKLYLPSQNFKIKLAVRRGIVAGCGNMGALEVI